MLWYHHCRPLESIVYDTVTPRPEHADPDFQAAYRWLEREVGFYPVFLAVGEEDNQDLVSICHYDHYWRVLAFGDENQKKGGLPNDVLFSFAEAKGVFTDYQIWADVIFGDLAASGCPPSEQERIALFRPGLTTEQWLRKARRYPVQLLTPSLHLPDAQRVWVRNKPTKKQLEEMGFQNVEVKRVKIL